MAFERCATLGGPCMITTCDASYVSVGDVELLIEKSFRDLESSLAGKVNKLLTGTKVQVKFKPVPIPAYALTLITLQPTDIGTSIFGCADCFCKIIGRDGTQINLKAAAVVDPPELNISSASDLFGDVTFEAVVANNVDISTTDGLKAITTVTFIEPADAHDTSLWINRGGKVTWGEDAPFLGMSTEEGVKIKIAYETTERKDDLNGIYNKILSGVSVAVTFKPLGLSVANFFTLMPVDGANASLGTSLATLARELVASHFPTLDGLVVTLPAAAPTKGQLNWGRTVPRFGEIGMEAVASIDEENLPNPIYSLEIAEA